MSNLFEKVQSRLKMLEQPHMLNHLHRIGLLHFAAEAANELIALNCDGRHTLWVKYATHPTVKKVIENHCRHQPMVCEALLSLPHNPLIPIVINAFDDVKGAFALERILKNLMQRNAIHSVVHCVAQRVDDLTVNLPLRDQHDLAQRRMESCCMSPLVDPQLTVESFKRLNQFKQNPLWDQDPIKAVTMKVGLAVATNPHEFMSCAKYYIDHLDGFETMFYDTLLQSIGWDSGQTKVDIPQLVAALTPYPRFEIWLHAMEKSNNQHHMPVIQLLINQRQNTVLRSVVDEPAKQQSIKKM